MGGTDGAAAGPWRHLYGRRHGKKLKPSQQRLLAELLPRLRLAGRLAGREPGAAAARARGALRRPQAALARGRLRRRRAPGACRAANPALGLVGCEPFVNGVAKALAAIEAAGVDNVRLHPGDARDLIELLPAGAVGRVFLLYPDPWPKARHARRRFASRENLALLAPAVAPGAELRLATDIEAYAEHALAEVAEPGVAHRGGQPRALGDWPGTRYEAKALEAGRRPRYITVVRL